MTYRVNSNLTNIKSATDATTYQLTLDDQYYVAFNGQTLNLPDPNTCIGRLFYIKLGANHSAHVTLQCVHGATTYNIDGTATHTITKNWGVMGVIAGRNSAGTVQWLLIQHIDQNL